MTSPDSTLRLIVIEGSLRMISNDGDTIETAINVTRTFPEVEYAEVGNTDADSYVPSIVPNDANEVQDYGPFQYDVYVRDGVNIRDLAARLQSNIEETLSQQGINCAIMIEA